MGLNFIYVQVAEVILSLTGLSKPLLLSKRRKTFVLRRTFVTTWLQIGVILFYIVNTIVDPLNYDSCPILRLS